MSTSAMLFATLLMAGCVSTNRDSTVEARGIVLISVEALRKDALALHGGEVELPNVARLAAMGTVFDDAATVAPLARPAAATLLTGVAPDRAGIRDNLIDVFPAGGVSLPARLAEAGWTTVGISGTPVCSYASGLHRGFELFDGPEDIAFGSERYFPIRSPGKNWAERFTAWLEGLEQGRPFFGWLHLADLHGVAIREKTAEESRAAYDETLRELDAAVGLVLDKLEQRRLLEGTAVVLVGTHGVLLGEDGARGAPYWLRAETLDVPLLVKAPTPVPGFEPGARSAVRAWLPDIPATLAGWAGVTLPAGAEGVDLSSGAAGVETRVRYAWSWAPEDEAAWPSLTAVDRGEGWRAFGWDELAGAVDDEDDPALDLARERPAEPRPRELSDDFRRRLEESGIVESWEEHVEPTLPSAERNVFFSTLQGVRHPPHKNMRPRERWRRSAALAEQHVENLATLSHVFAIMIGSNASVRATASREQALPLYPLRPEILHWAGHSYLLESDVARGELLVEAALSMVGTEPDMIYDLACTRALQGDSETALDRLEQAIEAGWRDFEHIEQDAELESVRTHPRYAEIMGKHGR